MAIEHRTPEKAMLILKGSNTPTFTVYLASEPTFTQLLEIGAYHYTTIKY